jgi:hypothetical protein
MPRMGVSKDKLEGRKPLPSGFYEFRCDGFKPKASKDKNSTNFNPQLKVINNAQGLNDEFIFFNLNSNAGWIMKDFVHCLGLQMEVDGDQAFMPGNFKEDPNDSENVEKYKYEGPMVGRTGRVEIGVRKDDKNKDQSYVKQLLCKVPGCVEKHSTDLK